MARLFNGTTQHLTIPSGASELTITGDISIFVRFRLVDTAQAQMFIDTTGAAGWSLGVNVSAADSFTLNTDGAGNIRSASFTPDTNWHTLLVTGKVSDTVTQFILDGTDIGVASGNYFAPTGGSAATKYIGRNVAGGEFMDGALAEIALWDVVLSADDANALTKGFSPLLIRRASLKSYRPLIGQYSPESDLMSGTAATLVSAPTQEDHPRVLQPMPYRLGRLKSTLILAPVVPPSYRAFPKFLLRQRAA